MLIDQANNDQNALADLRYIKKDLTKTIQTEVVKWKPSTGIGLRAQTPPFQVLDFFCGCGGMSLGFAALSKIIPFCELVGGCDIENDALATYSRNFGVPGVNMDIRDLVDDDLAISNFLSKLPRYSSKRRTIVIGCAPCQGFTSHRKRHWDNDDHRNTLLGAFASVAVKLSPDCVVMENVPEMLSNKYWSHFKDAKAIFEEAGYTVSQAIYNAASFGVPQERFRALVIAMKKSFILPEPQILTPSHYKTVRSAISHLPSVAPGESHSQDSLHRSAAHRESTVQTIKCIPKDGGSRPVGVGPKCLDRVKGFSDVYGRLAWDRPAITITHYARNPASGRYVHPEQDRGLTKREAAILQSFPNGFEFCGSIDSVFKQIGEAVPPLFAAAVAASCAIELVSREPNLDELEKAVQPITNPVSSSFSSVIAGIKIARNKK
jgi:DNA (cytosine-5)-methyltransferase 1